MKRFLFLASLLLCSIITSSSFAQENVPLRAGLRDGYTRLTLGWKENVKYKLDTSDSKKFVISFDKDGSIDQSKIDLSELKNIKSIKVLESNPLKLEFSIPEGSKVRGFKIGKRVIVDVHDSSIAQNESEEDVKIAAAAPVVESKPEEKDVKDDVKADPTPDPEPVEVEKTEVVEKKPEEKRVVEVTPPLKEELVDPEEKGGKEAELNIALVPEREPEIKRPEPEERKKKPRVKNLDKLVKQENHVISLRSTRAMELAVFENYGELWIALDDKETFVTPDLSTPRPELFSEFQSMQSDPIRILRMDIPDQILNFKATGGGLIWDIIMSEDLQERAPTEPVRKVVKRGEVLGEKFFWPLKNITQIINVRDEVTGQDLHVVMVDEVSALSNYQASYVEFDVLESPVGIAIRPKVEDLEVELVDDGIEIFRPSGLSLARASDISEARMYLDRSEEEEKKTRFTPETNNFFRFKKWQLGKASEIEDNENVLLAGLKQKSSARQVEDLIALGKMFLSHGRGAEALGYFNYALAELPAVSDSPEYKALTGVSKALDWKSDAALEDFLTKGLDEQDEVKFWKSYVLADLGDWQQAVSILPDNYDPLRSYPDRIKNRLALVLAEVNLRNGQVDKAKELMSIVEESHEELILPVSSALQYLKGEAHRQSNRKDKAEKIWEELSEGEDDLYRTKAALALTILLLEEGKIDNDQAIDRLERLRYSWRGDELEAQVQYWLGVSYFEDKQYAKGLAIMRDAAAVAGSTALGNRIATHMSKTFSNLFIGEQMEDVPAVEAVALYEQFSELTPVGKEGDLLVQMLAERLVSTDLLGRATKLLRGQVDHRLEGEEKVKTAIRLAAIELMDKQPQKAMNALGKAVKGLRLLPTGFDDSEYQRRISLLKIRAYAMNDQYDKSLSLLAEMPLDADVNLLKADIAWQAGYWEDAADFLSSVITDQNITNNRPLTPDQADLILRRAVSLSLANDRIALGNMRSKYNDLMLQTHKAHQFEVITRPRNSTTLADRETLLSIVSEVDLFKDFLESFSAAEATHGLPAADGGEALN